MGPWSVGLGVAGGIYGSMQDRKAQRRAEHYRASGIRGMIKAWKRAYAESQGQFDQERQNIMGREQSAMGGVTASAAGAGLLNTTVGANMARGVRSDTNRALGDLASKKAATEYGQWMDLGAIRGQWGNVQAPESQAGAWGQFGAELGGLFDKKE